MKYFMLIALMLGFFSLQAQLTVNHTAFIPLYEGEILTVRSLGATHEKASVQIPKEEVNFMSRPKVGFENVYCPAFFCRVEDAIAKSSKVNFKFRLGSVNYVDAMEGKGYFEASSNSRATDLQISRTK